MKVTGLFTATCEKLYVIIDASDGKHTLSAQARHNIRQADLDFSLSRNSCTC